MIFESDWIFVCERSGYFMNKGIIGKYKNVEGTLFNSVQLKTLIYPLIIEQILAITVGLADTIMISYAGEAAMSGVSLVDMINHLLNSIFAAIATGGAVVVSQYLGNKNVKRASDAATELITVAAIIASCFMVTALVTNRSLLGLLFGNIEAEVMDNAAVYFMISAWSYPFLAVFNACAAIFRSMGNAKISMKISIGMNIFNAIGNAILIFGFSMGAAGAAISSFIARMLGAVVLFVLVTGSRNEVRADCKKLCKLEADMVKKILNIGIPNGVENGIFQLGRVIVVSIIATFGTAQIAANAVANTLDSMGCVAGHAMNLAMITVVGQCMGAGDKGQAVYYAKKLWKITYIITIIINTAILFTLPLTLNFFSLSPEARRYAFILVMIHNGMAMLLWPTSFTMPNALRAAGDVRFCMFISIVSMFIFRVIFSIIIGKTFGLGAIGVWIAMVIDWIFRSSMFVWRFIQGKWLDFKVI